MAVKTNKQGKTLDVSALENWSWEAACVIREPVDAPKFKDYILPLIFLKRLSDVFDEEVARLGREFGDERKAIALVQEDHKLVRFFLTQKARWSEIALRTTGLGEYLTEAVRAVARENPQPSQTVYDPCCGSGGCSLRPACGWSSSSARRPTVPAVSRPRLPPFACSVRRSTPPPLQCHA